MEKDNKRLMLIDQQLNTKCGYHEQFWQHMSELSGSQSAEKSEHQAYNVRKYLSYHIRKRLRRLNISLDTSAVESQDSN